MTRQNDRLYIGAGGVDAGTLGIVGPHQLGRISVSHDSDGKSLPEIKLSELLVYDGAKDLFADLMKTYAAYSGVSTRSRTSWASCLAVQRLGPNVRCWSSSVAAHAI